MKKTMTFFIASIATIVLVIIFSNFTHVTRIRSGCDDPTEGCTIASEDNKVSLEVKHPIGKNINQFELANKSHNYIIYTLILSDDDEMGIHYEGERNDIDITKIEVKTEGNKIILNHNGVVKEDNYNSYNLKLTLPRRDWAFKMHTYNEIGIINDGEAVNVDYNVSKGRLSLQGHFKQVNLYRDGVMHCYTCVAFKEVSFDTMNVYFAGKNSTIFNKIDEDVSFNTINLYMNKENRIEIKDLSTLSKIHWSPLSESMREKLVPEQTKKVVTCKTPDETCGQSANTIDETLKMIKEEKSLNEAQ